MTIKRPRFTGPHAGFSPRLILLLVAALAMSGHDAQATDPFDPLAIYGTEHRFSVMRNGETVGSHRLRFERTPAGLTVEADFALEIPFLFFTAYRYSYRSVARWQDGRIVRLEAETDDDGERSRVTAEERGDGRLWIAGPKGSLNAPQDVLPTNHWNPVVVGRDQVLNTITGGLNAVTIQDLGEETVETSAGSVRARHYLYTGELDNEVWYDANGRWVKMRFPARDGSMIEYVCQTCGIRGSAEMSEDG